MKKQGKDEKKLPDEIALSEVFPNNPLKQVAFEVRFQRSLRVLCDIGNFQEKLGSEFIFTGREEILLPGEPPALGYGFAHRGGNLIVKAGEDRFAVIVTQYEHFEWFASEAMKQAGRFCDLFRIQTFKRVGLRYVNKIEVIYDGQEFLLERYVHPYVDLSRLEPAMLSRFSVELLTEKPDCKFNTRSAFASNPNPMNPEGSYILDLDAFIEKETCLAELSNVLTLLHNQAQIEFLTHVTEEYKTFMRSKNAH